MMLGLSSAGAGTEAKKMVAVGSGQAKPTLEGPPSSAALGVELAADLGTRNMVVESHC